ncbi:MAG: S8 family serine peptidase [Hyphomicrobiaceae bacterium]|nr:MAG: S8 family serine peptidase [Hyphomicrobiaceae bacterium]
MAVSNNTRTAPPHRGIPSRPAGRAAVWLGGCAALMLLGQASPASAEPPVRLAQFVPEVQLQIGPSVRTPGLKRPKIPGRTPTSRVPGSSRPPKVTAPVPPRPPPRLPPVVTIPEPGPKRARYLTSLPHRGQREPARLPVAEQSVPRQVVVLLGRDQPESVDAELARAHGLERVETQTLPLLDARAVLYRIRSQRSEQRVVAALSSDARVREVQLNYRYRHQSGPTAPGLAAQYGHLKVELPGAHRLAQGRNVIVAVIDSSVDLAHPDLQGAVARTFDAVGGQDRSPDFHGTAVAGIIRARGVLEGVAPQASLLAVRAFQVSQAGKLPETSSWILLRAIEWAVANDAKILNLSFVGPRDPAIQTILRAAAQRRVVAVAAAGNGGPKAPPAFPAAYPEVIAVTAVDERDRLYQYANRGEYVAVAAPGVDILAPVEKGKHSYLSGTSFATAYVSGIIALLMERDPGLDTNAVVDLIAAGAQDLGPKGRDQEFGAGRINALHSLQAMATARAEQR